MPRRTQRAAQHHDTGALLDGRARRELQDFCLPQPCLQVVQHCDDEENTVATRWSRNVKKSGIPGILQRCWSTAVGGSTSTSALHSLTLRLCSVAGLQKGRQVGVGHRAVTGNVRGLMIVHHSGGAKAGREAMGAGVRFPGVFPADMRASSTSAAHDFAMGCCSAPTAATLVTNGAGTRKHSSKPCEGYSRMAVTCDGVFLRVLPHDLRARASSIT